MAMRFRRQKEPVDLPAGPSGAVVSPLLVQLGGVLVRPAPSIPRTANLPDHVGYPDEEPAERTHRSREHALTVLVHRESNV
jgi:hypothetical protein